MKQMGNLMDEVKIYDDIIPKEIQRNLAATVKRHLWQYAWQTAPHDEYPVWGRSVANPIKGNQNAEQKLLANGHQMDSAAIWKLLTESFLKGHSLMRAFVIGFHHGCEGYAHGDNTDPEDQGLMGNGLSLANYRSTIIFAIDEWKTEWGGEMLFYDREMKDIICAVEPKPFRVITFPGLLPHKPNGPTRETAPFLPLLSFRSKQILRF